MAEKVKMLIPEEEVNARIEELGKKISEEYAGKQGSSDLCFKGWSVLLRGTGKRITVPVTMDFMSVSAMVTEPSPVELLRLQKIWMSLWKEKRRNCC